MDNHTAGSRSGGSGDGGALRRNSRKPKYSKFTQQEFPACKPILTPKWVISVFVLVGVIFVPIGVASLLASRKVVEIVDRYDDACIPPNMTDKLAYIQNSTISKICTRTLKVPKDMTPAHRRFLCITGWISFSRIIRDVGVGCGAYLRRGSRLSVAVGCA